MKTTILLALLIAAAGIAATAEIDQTTGLTATDVVGSAVLDRDGDVLWDITHGVYIGYDPSNRYSDLAALLAAAGMPVAVTDQGVDNIDLSPYCILVLASGSAYDTPYTASEVAAIDQFVADGGGLLVLAENGQTPAVEHLGPVASAFGTTIIDVTLDPLDTYISNFAAHEIFTGIDEIMFRACGVLEASAPSVAVAWTANDEVMVTVVEPHKVVIAADSNFCDNDYMVEADNQAFALSIFEWLCDGTVGTENHSWSEVKQRFR
jgi:hypothetical protein